MIPDGFAWQSICGPGSARDRNALAVAFHQVARMDQSLAGHWIATLYYPDGRRVTRICTSEAAGRAGCEVWAARHQSELREWAELRNLRWLARQGWRGRDSLNAQAKLRELGFAIEPTPDEIAGFFLQTPSRERARVTPLKDGGRS